MFISMENIRAVVLSSEFTWFYCSILGGIGVVFCWLSIKKKLKISELDCQLSEFIQSLKDNKQINKQTNIYLYIEEFIRRAKSSRGQINVAAYIDEKFHEDEVGAAIRGAIPTLIMLGLVGTFGGLVFAIHGINPDHLIQTLASGDYTNFAGQKNSLKEAIGTPLNGMKLAFLSSLAGVISSMFLGGFEGSRKHAETKFLLKLENFFSNVILQKYMPSTWEETGRQVAKEMGKVADVLQESLKGFLAQFNEEIQKRFQESMLEITGRLQTTAQKVEGASEHLISLTDTFARSASTFDRAGAKFGQTVEQMPEHVDALGKNMFAFLDNLERVTGKHANQVETQQQTVEKYLSHLNQTLDTTIKGFADSQDTFTEALRNQLETMTIGFQAAMSEFGQTVDDANQAIMMAAGNRAEEIVTALTETTDEIKSQHQILSNQFQTSLELTQKATNETTQVIAEFIEVLTQENVESGALLEKTNLIQEKLTDNLGKLQDFPRVVEQLGQMHGEANREMSGLIATVREWMEEEKNSQTDVLRKVEAANEGLFRQYREHQETVLLPCLNKIHEVIQKSGDTFEALETTQKDLNLTTQRINDASREYARVIQHIGNHLERSADNLAKNLDELAVNRGGSAELSSSLIQAMIQNERDQKYSKNRPAAD